MTFNKDGFQSSAFLCVECKKNQKRIRKHERDWDDLPYDEFKKRQKRINNIFPLCSACASVNDSQLNNITNLQLLILYFGSYNLNPYVNINYIRHNIWQRYHKNATGHKWPTDNTQDIIINDDESKESLNICCRVLVWIIIGLVIYNIIINFQKSIGTFILTCSQTYNYNISRKCCSIRTIICNSTNCQLL